MPEPSRRQVLITRPEPDATETAALVLARGFVPVLAPLLRVRTGALAGPPEFDALLLTSRNAVPALPPHWVGVPVLAVGTATAGRARQAGFTAVYDAEGDAVALAALAGRLLPPGARLLLAHGRGQGMALAVTLRGSGFRVRRRCAYTVLRARLLPAPGLHALRSGELHAALFLSADTARAFVRLLPASLAPALAGVDALAIGHGAAAVLTPLPWRRVRVSLRPSLDHVLGLL